jgi:hypothetical protein
VFSALPGHSIRYIYMTSTYHTPRSHSSYLYTSTPSPGIFSWTFILHILMDMAYSHGPGIFRGHGISIASYSHEFVTYTLVMNERRCVFSALIRSVTVAKTIPMSYTTVWNSYTLPGILITSLLGTPNQMSRSIPQCC